MKGINNSSAFKAPSKRCKKALFHNLDYSTLVALGALMALVLLSGCKSPPLGGSPDPEHYNTSTGYPAVGGSSSTF